MVRDIERDDIEFISRTLHCLPIAHPDHMRPDKLGAAQLVEEASASPRRPCPTPGCQAACMHVSVCCILKPSTCCQCPAVDGTASAMLARR